MKNTKQRDWCIGVCLCVGVRERQNEKHWESLYEARMATTATTMKTTTTTTTSDDYSGHQRPKGIKIQTKNAHTRYEIATTIIKHAQIHYTRCRYQMCIYGNDVCLFLGSISSEEAERKKKHTQHTEYAYFFPCGSLLYIAGIFTLTIELSGVVVVAGSLSSSSDSFDGRVIFDGFFYLFIRFFFLLFNIFHSIKPYNCERKWNIN